jgi:hypothetical protein
MKIYKVYDEDEKVLRIFSKEEYAAAYCKEHYDIFGFTYEEEDFDDYLYNGTVTE